MNLVNWSKKITAALQQAVYEPENPYNPIRWDGENDQWILVKLSDTEHKEMLSALYNGALLTYGDDASRVLWHWLKHVEYPYMFCDLIAACIEQAIGTDNDLDLALYHWLISRLQRSIGSGDDLDILLNRSGAGGGSGGAGGVPGADGDLVVVSACDPDVMYGFTRQLVSWIDFMIRDLFEALEALTNFLEFWAAVTDGVPLLGGATDLVEAIQDSFYDAYLANHTEALEVQYACDLFCIAMSRNCVLTWEDVTRYFAEKMEVTFTDTLEVIFEILVTGTFSSEQYVAMFFHLVSEIIYKGGSWIGVDLETIKRFVQSFLNDPDSDWETLCDECPQGWHAHWDVAASSGGWTLQPGFVVGQWIDGAGWRTSNAHLEDYYQTRCQIRQTIATPVTFHLTRLQVNIASVSYHTDMAVGEWSVATSPLYAAPVAVKPDGAGEHSHNYDHEYVDAAVFYVDFRSNHGFSYGGQMTIDTIDVWGTGTPPQEFIDNADLFEYT